MVKKSYNILGVRVDNLTLDEALEKIKKCQVSSVKCQEKNRKTFHIVTVNPEFVVLAQENKTFKKVINRASLSLPDGIGILLAGVLSGERFKERITGVQLLEKLCQWAAKEGLTVGLIGGRPKIAVAALECLKKRYPGLKGWADSGPWVDDSLVACQAASVPAKRGRSPLSDGKGKGITPGSLRDCWLPEKLSGSNHFIKPTINTPFWGTLGVLRRLAKTDILFVAMGAPKQEFFIKSLIDIGRTCVKNCQDRQKRRSYLRKKGVLVAMGVGGAFDELAGRLRPAPGWVEKFGLKWVWRLLQEPWRLRRQLKLLEFVYLVILEVGKREGRKAK